MFPNFQNVPWSSRDLSLNSSSATDWLNDFRHIIKFSKVPSPHLQIEVIILTFKALLRSHAISFAMFLVQCLINSECSSDIIVLSHHSTSFA